MRLANGQTPKEISSNRDVSIHTVRNQIQTVLTKTDCKTAPEMVKTITGMSSKFQTVQFETQALRKEEIGNQNTLRPAGFTSGGGRYFRYFEQGHPNGKPVIFIPSLMYDVGLSSSAAKRAVLFGLRFIIPMRAGYSDSDPNPQSDPESLVEATIEDLTRLIKYLGLDSVVLMSGWAGCYAQRLAIERPDLVSGLLQLNSVPLWKNEYLKTVRPRHRNIVKTSIRVPQVVPYLARLGKALMDSGRGEVFARSLDKDCEVDLRALDDPEILFAITNGFDEIARQGVFTFSEDMKTVHTNWIEDTKKLKTNVTLLKGDKHTDLPQSAYEIYKNAVPQAKIKHIKDGGSYLHLTHFEVVAKELQNLFAKNLT